MKKEATTITTLSLVSITILSGIVLASSEVSADDSAVDTTTITVPVSCTMSGNIATGQEHSATLQPGTYSGASGSDYENGIGKTTLTTFCNDDNGFSIYAVGFTGEAVGNNTLVGANTSSTINTKVYESTDTASNWSMKVNKVDNPQSGDPVTYNPDNMTITNSFNSWHAVPSEYTKVAEYKSTTGPATTDTTLGAKVETTYAAYVSQDQPADIYTGKVKYVMVHPYSAVAGKLNVTYNGNGLTFANGKTTNLVAYNATETTTTGTVTKKSYKGSYDSEGNFSNSGTPAGNEVVTIDGASTIHITVTYGAPQNNGGPSSDLMIWAGNHPDYNNTNNSSSALTSCGSTSAVNGAFSSNGSGGTQVTMECDIAGDSVTFYDYSTNTNNTASMGYYAVVTGQGDITTYHKTVDSGTYATPSGRSGQDVFLGWSTNPNANAEGEGPLYADEADFIANATYVNDDTYVTLYAVWGKTFNAAYADAGKSQLSNYYQMQDATDTICKEIYVGATGTLIDARDNTTYTVGRLNGGKCWFLDNLALDLTNSTVLSGMTQDNTNASNTTLGYLKGTTTRDPSTDASGKYATAGVSNWTSSYSYSAPLVKLTYKDTVPSDAISQAGQYKIGGYYNYCAASAGSYCYGNGTSYGTSSGDATEDICPKGWRMPTGGSSGEYQALYNNTSYHSYANYRDALRLPLSGYFYNGSASNQGSRGRFWSSTRSSDTSMYGLYLESSYVGPSGIGSRNNGISLRCLQSS